MFEIQWSESYEIISRGLSIFVGTCIVNSLLQSENDGRMRSAESAMLLHVLMTSISIISGLKIIGYMNFVEQIFILMLHCQTVFRRNEVSSILVILIAAILPSCFQKPHQSSVFIVLPGNILMVLFNNACHRVYGLSLSDRMFLTAAIGYVISSISTHSIFCQHSHLEQNLIQNQLTFDILKWFVLILLLFGQLSLLYPNFKVNSFWHACLYLGAIVLLSACVMLTVTQWMFDANDNVLSWLFHLLSSNQFQMMYLSLIWSIILIIAIPIISLTKTYFKLSTIAGRKLFHFLAVALFAPVLSWPGHLMETFLSLAFGVAVCVLLVIEFIRVSAIFKNIKSIQGNKITAYYNQFLDEKDQSGKIVLSHIYLLLGIAIPFWLWLVLKQQASGEAFFLVPTIVENLRIMKHFGWLTLGLGDSMSALGGRAYGSFKWPLPHCNKTFEGSLIGFVSMIMVLPILLSIEYRSHSTCTFAYALLSSSIGQRCCGALAMASLAEAVTADNDNIVMPITACISFLLLTVLFIWDDILCCPVPVYTLITWGQHALSALCFVFHLSYYELKWMSID